MIVVPNEYKKSNLRKLIVDADVSIGSWSQSNLVNYAHKLKVYQNTGAGVDNFNLSLFQDKNIIIGNTHENSIYVAEYAIAILFYILKNFDYYFDNRNNRFKKVNKIPTKTLYKKKIGLIGYGAISKRIQSLMKGFENNFFINLLKKNKKNQKKKNKNLKKILELSDIIFICVPLTSKTKNLINKDNSKILKNKIIINISRAEVIDPNAVKSLIKHNILIYDSNYSDKKKSKELEDKKSKNLLLSHYIAAIDEFASFPLSHIATNLINYSIKGRLINYVDYEKEY